GDAVPPAGGRHWTLCGGSGTACSNAGQPAKDQYTLRTTNSTNGAPSVILTNGAQCDIAFSPTACRGVANASTTEYLQVTGPTDSTDNSGSLTTTITWMVSS